MLMLYFYNLYNLKSSCLLTSLFYKDEQQQDPRICINSATVYVNATDQGFKALDLWCTYSEKIQEAEKKCISFQDQLSLYFMTSSHPIFSIKQLPIQYCKIFDHALKGIDPKEIVIEQRQASRRFHKKIT